jgi:hypothetical protein
MKTGNRIMALQETIKNVAEVATVLEPSGMSIRFINSRDDGNFDHLTDVDDIMKKVQRVEYKGDTKLGTNLQLKVASPMVLEKANNKTFKKPLIVAVITDGEVSFAHLSGP